MTITWTHTLRGARDFCLLCAVALFSACAGGDDAGSNAAPADECTSTSDCDGGTCVDGQCVLADEDAEDDTPEPDVRPDTPDVEVDNGPTVEIGDPCDEDADCPSGWCIEVAGGNGQKVCTDFCNGDDDCPDDWVCAAVANSGADRTFLCFPEADFLCNGCDTDEQCGGRSDWCLTYSDGNFCGRSCDVRACPDGFDCVEIPREDGASFQCQLSAGFCSGCFDPDNDGHGTGDECLGIDCDEQNPNIHESAAEICDGRDDNCDGVPDETFDLATDVDHCGECNNRCRYDGAEALCAESRCALGPCLENRYDIDERPDNGCEYFCEVDNGGVEVCNGADENCDGRVDETFDLQADVNNCGQCDRVCSFPHAVPACDEGDCAIGRCDELWYDIDRMAENGCEYACVTSNGAVEVCDTIDNDCDGRADEDFDLNTNVAHCGACNRACDLDRAIETCAEGICGIANCEAGYDDCNEEIPDGCEVNLREDRLNCGECGDVCAPFEADGICRAANCEILACRGTHQNCDLRHDTGCESDRLVDPDNCGRCGAVCNFPNAARSCEDSRCVMGDCAPGWVDLDGSEVNGCEYRCTRTQDDDQPDPDGIDADCDGVDGNIEHAVFVRSNGNDLNNGLTSDAPVATIGRALQITAGPFDRNMILVVTGSYATDTTLALRGGVSLYGGYSPNFRTRDDSRATLTANGTNTVFRADGLTGPVNIVQINLTVANRTNESEPAIAMTVNNSGDRLTLRDLDVTAGRGGPGDPGANGSNGTAGHAGTPGSGADGGPGGSLGGGGGATGRRRDTGPAGGGGASNGSNCGGSAGGGSGSGGLGCDDGDPRSGGNGGGGCNGNTGGHGTRGDGTGTLSTVSWSRSNGTAGGAATHGGGGGGGGAGGGENCTIPVIGCIFCGTGRGGGGGGGGGTAGGGGTGGTGGGASIGILIRNSTVTVVNVDVVTVGGGNGGRGGNGGSGGGGGAGGPGGTDNDNTTGEGGVGGAGGAGGNGGCGGGGGGGPSVAVWGNGGAGLRRSGEASTFTAGTNGAGGPSCGNVGQPGERSDTLSVSIQ